MGTLPYVLSIGRLYKVPPLSVLNKLKVCAVIVEATDYFDSITHLPAQHPMNSNLRSQMTYLSQNNVPAGVFTILRGRSVSEVTSEMTCLLNSIVDLTIDVGVWIDVRLTSRNLKSDNDKLLECCYTILSANGFKDQIGLKFNPDQLSLFNYDEHVSHWVMWLNKHTTNSAELSSVLYADIVPDQFFEVKS